MIRNIVSTSEQIQITQSVVEFYEKYKCSLLIHYGPSETHVVTASTLSGAPAEWPRQPSIGKPIANTDIYLLDEELWPVPIGIPGELFVGGANLARGYWNKPSLTAEKFIPTPFKGVG